jgi:hypothetical protein
MNIRILMVVSALFLSTCGGRISTAHAQGSLTPPGAPSATMLTLSQIEPRTPISSAPYSILIPGSYYLTTNVSVSSGNAINILASGVTLDLGGWTISSTAPVANGAAIWFTNSLRNISIFNGFIQGGITNNGSGVYDGPGFQYGIYYPVFFNGHGFIGYPGNVRISNLSVGGCLYDGIHLYDQNSDSSLVQSCNVRTVGGSGIVAPVIRDSVAIDCGSTAIYGDVISGCEGQAVDGYGIYATSTAQNCYGYSTSEPGLTAYNAVDCEGYSNASYGVNVYTAEGCSGDSVNGVGLYAYNLALGCFGQSAFSTGLYAYNAAFCSANVDSGTALQAVIANGCIATFEGTNNVMYKYNMP